MDSNQSVSDDKNAVTPVVSAEAATEESKAVVSDAPKEEAKVEEKKV